MSIFGDLSQLENQHKCKEPQVQRQAYIWAPLHESVRQPTWPNAISMTLPALTCLVALVTARPVPQTCSTSVSLFVFAILTFVQLPPTPVASLNHEPLSRSGLFSYLITASPPLSKYPPSTVPTNQPRHPHMQTRNHSSHGSTAHGISSAMQSRTSRSRSLSRGTCLKIG